MKASPKLLPVGYPVYNAISQLNRSFDECSEGISHLTAFNLVSSDNLRAYRAMVEEIRAFVNQEFTEVISDRELQNSTHYERLRLKWESQFRGPEDAKAQEPKTPARRPERKKVRR